MESAENIIPIENVKKSYLILFGSFNVFQDRLIVFLIFWLIVFKHSENLKRLYEGRENKF